MDPCGVGIKLFGTFNFGFDESVDGRFCRPAFVCGHDIACDRRVVLQVQAVRCGSALADRFGDRALHVRVFFVSKWYRPCSVGSSLTSGNLCFEQQGCYGYCTVVASIITNIMVPYSQYSYSIIPQIDLRTTFVIMQACTLPEFLQMPQERSRARELRHQSQRGSQGRYCLGCLTTRTVHSSCYFRIPVEWDAEKVANGRFHSVFLP